MDFLKQHGEKLLAGVCLLGLILSVVFGLVLTGGGDNMSSGNRIAGGGEFDVDLEAIDANLSRIQDNPFAFPLSTNRLFTAEERRLSVHADYPVLIPADATVNPYTLKKEEIADVDSDGGGMYDKVEQRYGLNPQDSADDDGDLDGDGFSNLAELAGDFDPSDPQSRPALLDVLRVKRVAMIETVVQLRGSAQAVGGYTLQLAVKYPGQAQGRTAFVKTGSTFGRNGEFKLTRFIKQNKLQGSKYIDTSFAEIEVGGDRKRLTRQEPLVLRNNVAELGLLTDADWLKEVRVGTEFALDGATYVVAAIDGQSVSIRDRNTATVTNVPKSGADE